MPYTCDTCKNVYFDITKHYERSSKCREDVDARLLKDGDLKFINGKRYVRQTNGQWLKTD